MGRSRGNRKPKIKNSIDKLNGWVYIMKIWLDGIVVYKVGTTNRQQVEARMLEIAGEILGSYGEIPRMKLVKAARVVDNYGVEAKILDRTSKYRYYPKCEFGSCSELRDMGEKELVSELARCSSDDRYETSFVGI